MDGRADQLRLHRDGAGDGGWSFQVDFLKDKLAVFSAYEFHYFYLGVAVSLEPFVSHRISNQCRHTRLSNQGQVFQSGFFRNG